MKMGTGSCFGTFGELVQGVHQERPFLITLPIPALQSRAVFIPNDRTDITGPSFYKKAILACKSLLQCFEITSGGCLYMDSNIPVGKGMASSSADLIASMKAVAASYELPVSEEILSILASSIEPTDGVMYDGIVAYDYKSGRLLESFGQLPPCRLIGIDTGGTVNTIAFNQLPKSYTNEEKQQCSKAYHLIREGMKSHNLSDIFRASTMSAAINQRFLPNPYFHTFFRLHETYGGGIVVAHSGTMIGLLIAYDCPYWREIEKEVKGIEGEEVTLYSFIIGKK
ncbi:kinase [Ectobacillus sp. sgz5001026]|uniref:GHMP family kinase ATP-binding protein n=1 Tax=Ectobacillus sp. sgz5001026 TaxID=3242473 RepID=UPI0036D25CAD